MLTASWESSAGALLALLNGDGKELVMCELYTITLLGGQTLRYTDSDVAKTIGARTFALGPILSRGRIKRSVGISVDTLTVKLSASAAVTVNSTPMIKFIALGGFTNARIQLERLYAGADGVPVGAVVKFTGRVAEIGGGRHEKTLELSSDTELLDVMVPRDVYQPGCKNTLFDGSCRVNRATFTFAGTATSATDVGRTTFSHGLGQAAGYFDLGSVKFTSGLNVGISRTVKRHPSGQFIVAYPWPFAVAIGDTFSAEAGCNKSNSDANGCPKFYSSANVIKFFRGEPWIPAPETVV